MRKLLYLSLVVVLIFVLAACNPTQEVTPEPDVTDEPQETAEPEETDEPMETDEPQETDEPKETDEPVSDEEFEVPVAGVDPLNVIYTAVIEEAKVADLTKEELPEDAFSDEPFEEKEAEDELVVPENGKLHPVIREWLDSRDPDEREQVMINLVDDIQIPAFPEPNPDEPRDSDANQRAMREAEALVEELTNQRAESYKELEAVLGEELEVRVLETFWLVNSILVEMPIGAIPKLIERDDVLYVEPEVTGDAPPQNGNNDDDVQDGRASIVSDPYFNLGQTNGFIGLLDSGIRTTHTLFASPSNVDFIRDCVNGTSNNCTSGSNLNPEDDCWNHGTSSAAIISGNNNLGNPFRGVTGITLDSFKIYPTSFDDGSCVGWQSTSATIRGFEAAVAVLDRIIVAEMQSSGDEWSSISTAAENAFNAGAVIIAANGNNGSDSGTVNVPAIAHKVIGVGAFDVDGGAQYANQSRGPANDNRYKPDIQAPNRTETARNTSDTALGNFGGTSGATPYAAGAAALLRNWLRGNSGSIDPGQVYAQLILSGQDPYPFDNTVGAGRLNLPVNGIAKWGKVSVTDGMTIEIPFVIQEGWRDLDAALWWPENNIDWSYVGIIPIPRINGHNDIDLRLIDPGGTARDFSVSIPSVFERASVEGELEPGTWIIQIRGYDVDIPPETVYWAAHVVNR